MRRRQSLMRRLPRRSQSRPPQFLFRLRRQRQSRNHPLWLRLPYPRWRNRPRQRRSLKRRPYPAFQAPRACAQYRSAERRTCRCSGTGASDSPSGDAADGTAPGVQGALSPHPHAQPPRRAEFSAASQFLTAGPRAHLPAPAAILSGHRAAHPANLQADRVPSIQPARHPALQDQAAPGLPAHVPDSARGQALAGRRARRLWRRATRRQAEHRRPAKLLARSAQHQEGAADGRSIPRRRKAR